MRTIFLVIIFSFFWMDTFAQSSVYLEGNEIGRGILKERSGEIFVICPAHVIENTNGEVKVIGENNVQSKGEVVQSFANDLAVVRIVSGGIQKNNIWSIPSNYSKMIDVIKSGYIEIRDNFGKASLMDVSIQEKDNQTVSIIPSSNSRAIIKGMSGSSMFFNYEGNKVFLGMLVEVTDEGKGIIIRADLMHNILSGFFTESASEDSQSKQTLKASPVSGFLGSSTEDGIKLTITKFETSGSKAIFSFTLENMRPAEQTREFRSYANSNELINQDGYKFEGKSIELGNSGYNTQLIYGVPVKCQIEFEVGAVEVTKVAKLTFRGGRSEFKFNNLDLRSGIENESINNNGPTSNVPPSNSKLINLGQIVEGNIRMVINSLEQGGGKATLNFTLENLSPSEQVKKYSCYANNAELIDQNGLKYLGKNIELGNTEHRVDLVYQFPVKCTVDFEIGAVVITKIANLKLNGSVKFEYLGNSGFGNSTNSETPNIDLDKIYKEGSKLYKQLFKK
ncbi:MAG: hypothetical protein IPG55_06720 [Saprospiraceae bacterium]|nr:hypothetical protein [Candidatus Defluviibacterium haderslevense]